MVHAAAREVAAYPRGAGGVLRLRVGRYRVLDEVGDATILIDVVHPGRGG